MYVSLGYTSRKTFLLNQMILTFLINKKMSQLKFHNENLGNVPYTELYLIQSQKVKDKCTSAKISGN